MSYRVPRMRLTDDVVLFGKLATYTEICKAHNLLAEHVESQYERIYRLENELQSLKERLNEQGVNDLRGEGNTE